MKTNHLFTVNFALVLFASTNLFAQTETRNVSAFDGIHVAGNYDVTLTKGTEGTLTLHGDQEDLDRIKTHVKNGNLVIEQTKTSWLESWNSGQVKIHIPVEAISKISLSGSGSIYSRNELNSNEFDITLSGSGEIDLNLNAQDINAVLTGSGDIELRGKASNVSYQLTGSGDIKSPSLEALHGYAKVTGSGEIEMYASDSLNGHLTGSGDILCHGKPKIQQIKTTGSGSIEIQD